MKADLHMHSVWSDGKLNIKELIDRAVEKKVEIIAITDHDVIASDIDKWIEYGMQRGIKVIPGIELSTVESGKSVHLLGYFTNRAYVDESLRISLASISNRRKERAIKFIQNLKKYYDIEISYARVKEISGGIIARPHLAKAITEKYGYTHDETFELFLNQSSKAYVPTVKMSVSEGIKLLRKHQCLVVLAHPVIYPSHVFEKIAYLPYDGIEAYYFRSQPKDTDFFLQFAQKQNLLVTAGSDFHGIIGDTKHGDIGDLHLQGDALRVFLDRLKENI
jgi:predicted metal-dependent phosphoesterase TrpH